MRLFRDVISGSRGRRVPPAMFMSLVLMRLFRDIRCARWAIPSTTVHEPRAHEVISRLYKEHFKGKRVGRGVHEPRAHEVISRPSISAGAKKYSAEFMSLVLMRLFRDISIK